MILLRTVDAHDHHKSKAHSWSWSCLPPHPTQKRSPETPKTPSREQQPPPANAHRRTPRWQAPPLRSPPRYPGAAVGSVRVNAPVRRRRRTTSVRAVALAGGLKEAAGPLSLCVGGSGGGLSTPWGAPRGRTRPAATARNGATTLGTR